MIKNIQLLLVFILMGGNLAAQNTVGLISYNPTKSFNGYNLVYPHNQPNVYLLNNCGEIIHRWDDAVDFRPGNMAYLYPNGNLVKTKRPSTVAGNPIWAGGGGAIVVQDATGNYVEVYAEIGFLDRNYMKILKNR